ncbi:hypothetical protein NMG60_11018101 [Bertholletia excelsa]
MPVAKLRAGSTSDVMKSEEGNDSIDTLIRQAIGNSPVQLIQLLHVLDQPDLPGWPLLSQVKVQMQKCEKCSLEFCSPINYRRHMRVHRRSLNIDKDSHKNRDLLGAFWDKLSLDEAEEILSFKDMNLEEVPGASVIQALTSFFRKPGFYALPQSYVKAGSVLLDIIQARPSRLPISSQELFGILDHASERTFLCAGTADSMQKYVFVGEIGKIGLEMRNLVACTSFLVEQKLVRAWLVDKDAEALRCQKLLVEEEEAAQRRQAELLERKRRKKLRQKEQKAKELPNAEKAELCDAAGDTLESLPSAATSSHPEDADIEAQNGFSSGHSDSDVRSYATHGNGDQHVGISRWQVPKRLQRSGQTGFQARQNPQVLKLEAIKKHGGAKDPRASLSNGNKVWTRKPKSENYDEGLQSRLQKHEVNQADQNHEVIIGSISVTLGNCAALPHMPMKNDREKPRKADPNQNVLNGCMVEHLQSGSQQEKKGPLPAQSGRGESIDDEVIAKNKNRNFPTESCLSSHASYGYSSESKNNCQLPMEENGQPESFQISSHAAKAFLAQRWKEAISTDHVQLALNPPSESPDCQITVK